ncbi:hypothetical protein BX616_004077 [Lobosporangium transversale]|uniref:Bestrophin, RFP-TM, chloride channel-domain-containing protein n=1 Tax=Lobosporangium transversale TaxID=64571 RepID=A0A1Y2GPC3_9FUNG|nr:Bestrophin, RFP-TM, chloride channel-domain-containing protein [Lobosporangium transversale]KAF9898405.1 hypothetical protein BX616_004077 [Lobosporangium transversale]ORZ16115.1 Bestrophin, RFP-TM, chloride channel-domain-containing protein [Lobosporangium transversale]|eukprot:XP_021881462.1 Bestrophin, RFP-TM, chloride channel-domain-containing protein [Lobosporangium transversale]
MHGTYFKRPAEYYRRSLWTYPDTLRFRGSVIPSVIKDVVVITSFSYFVIFLENSKFFDGSLNIPNMIVPALSVVVGLILAFRTNTAYDRYWEGRKLWASLDVQIRNFSRMIWVGMKENRHETLVSPGGTVRLRDYHLFGRTNSKKSTNSVRSSSHNGHCHGNTATSRTENASSATLIDIGNSPQQQRHLDDDHEKILVIRLLLAFAVSVKHHLRQEFGIRHHDLKNLLPEDFEPCANENVELKPYQDKAIGDRHRLQDAEPWNIVAGNEDGQMSLPLEIAHGLSLWVITESRAGRIESSLIGNLLSSINSMVDIFTNMERIVYTPIPLAYSIHLRQVVYLYCLALPFTFISALGWLTVPLMCLVSFTLFGVEAIGREIENPFGKDANDLHMDDFCSSLKRELDYTVNLKNTVPGACA